MKTFDAVVIGDANIDLAVVGASEVPQPGQEVFVENVMLHVGGGAAVFSLALAKLGLRVAFNGILGDDMYGRYIREHFSQYGIDTRMIETSQRYPTGVSIAFNPDTDRSFITYAGTNMELQMDRLDLGAVAQGRHVHLTGYKGRSNHDSFVALARTLKEKGLTLSCDVGWDDTGEWYNGVFELMAHCDVFLMNETEALHYTGLENIEDSLRFMSQYCSHVAIKLGSKGSAAMRDGVLNRRDAYRVKAVDTTGAGDCFNAGYLFGFLTGKDTDTSLAYGNACGAFSVSQYGGSTGSPDAETMQAFISENEQLARKGG